MLKQQRVLDFCMICSTMIGVRRNLTRGHMRIFHPRIAVKNAEKITDLSDLERDIILKHMWGATIAPPKYKEGYIVTFVDKYCAVKEAAQPMSASMRKRWQRYFGKESSI